MYEFLGPFSSSSFAPTSIHQFDISGLSFATGSGRELGVKELCQLYVYNSIVRVKQSSVFAIRQKFLRFLKVLLSLRDLILRSSFFKSSCIRFARSDYRYSYICFVHRSGCWLLLVFCFYHRHYGLRTISKGKVQEIKSFLRLRGLNLSGRKEELIARVFVAYENNVPLIKSAEDVQQEIALEYRTLVRS